jgi:hypothetical protein
MRDEYGDPPEPHAPPPGPAPDAGADGNEDNN